MKKSELRQIIREEISKVLDESKSKKHKHTFESFLNEAKLQPLFKIGDKVTIKASSADPAAKKYNGKTGTVSSEPMEYSNGSYSYMVKVGRSEVEFRERELQSVLQKKIYSI